MTDDGAGGRQLPDRVDVLVVGAGISGIGAGRWLRSELPDKTFAIIEARAASGGTWDLFRYPGVRSDSDLFTYAYASRPWRSAQPIADGSSILSYLRESADEGGLDPQLFFRHRLLAAAWSSERADWRCEIERTDTGELIEVRAGWLFCASGYFREEGYTPDFPGRERFAGPIVHPQAWPADLDYTGRRVLVIGSGATAITLVPAMAADAAHVTMLQRTPSYVVSTSRHDPIAAWLRACLRESSSDAVIRWKNIAAQRSLWRLCRRFPKLARRMIRRITKAQLPPGYPVDEHFNPPYDPWHHRVCVAPDGDFFAAIREERASLVTDSVDTFTPTGVRLSSGRELDADIIVTATGFNVEIFGGIALSVDDQPVDVANRLTFRGMMLSDVPNLACVLGYSNATWTLKVDLICEHFCRLLAHLDAHGYDSCRASVGAAKLATHPIHDVTSSSIQRAADRLPKQGARTPWRTSTSYRADVRLLREADVVDPELHFSSRAPVERPSRVTAAGE